MDLPGAPTPLDVLRANLGAVYDRIEAARSRAAAGAPRVTLIAVTKAAPPGAYDWLRTLGEKDIGENRVQDAASKRASAPPGLTWHGIGHLQTNKVKKAVQTFDVFHALDSRPLAEAVASALAAAGRAWPVYVQVNAAHDPKKGGIPPEDALAFLQALEAFPTLEVVGFMTMAKEEDLGERARPCFAALRQVRDEAVRRGVGRVPPTGLSMGMSEDFEVAVEEGATVVRVGRALWRGLAPNSPVAAPPTARTVPDPRS